MAIAHCVRCCKAYHLRCYDKEKTIKLAKKLIICSDHKILPVKTKPAVEKREFNIYDDDDLYDDIYDTKINKKTDFI